MPSTLDLCDKYFGTRDVYNLLELTKDSLEKDIKKAYYKLSLKVHPDRVPENEKEVATEKFKILARLHSVLTDKNKKALYDEQGIIDDEDDEGKLASWLDIWRKIFKPLTTDEIDNYQKEYIGSELEKSDIKKSYMNGKGCINYMMNCVPFMSVEDEPRIQQIVLEMIAAGEVPEYKIFTNEPKNKRNRRHKKYARESKQAEKIKEKLDNKDGSSLELQIMKNQRERESNFGNFIKLLERYSNDDDSEPFDINDLGAKGKKKAKVNSKKPSTESKPKDRKVRSGRVGKR